MKVYIGIDWSKDKHDLAFMNEAGRVVQRKVIRHSEDGFWEMEHMRGKMGVLAEDCAVGIETADNMLVEFLWQQGYEELYIIPPKMTKSSRGRQRSSRARSDQSDADLLADLVRTDSHRLISWRPNRILTRQMAEQVNQVRFLSGEIVRVSNRLRAKLLRYYPAALQVFSTLAQNITLAFIQAYPDPIQARALSLEQFRRFALEQGYPQPKRLSACYLALQQAHIPVGNQIAVAYAREAVLLSQLLQKLVMTKKEDIKHLQQIFHQHPDWEIFASLPGAGDLLAPSLLVKFGDDRQRFPHPEVVQMRAGTCPVTIQSGRIRQVRYRYACDGDFRNIAVQFAKASLRTSAWANGYFQQALPRTKSISHAYRCLANRWLAIIWKLWQSAQTYDEAFHLQSCLKRRQPN
jgi:transposase